MLTPSHGKHVYALAVITAIYGCTRYAQNVVKLQRAEKDQLAIATRQEMTLASRLLEHTLSGNNVDWNETSPIASARCRKLDRSPTGPQLDILNMSPCKRARTM